MTREKINLNQRRDFLIAARNAYQPHRLTPLPSYGCLYPLLTLPQSTSFSLSKLRHPRTRGHDRGVYHVIVLHLDGSHRLQLSVCANSSPAGMSLSSQHRLSPFSGLKWHLTDLDSFPVQVYSSLVHSREFGTKQWAHYLASQMGQKVAITGQMGQRGATGGQMREEGQPMEGIMANFLLTCRKHSLAFIGPPAHFNKLSKWQSPRSKLLPNMPLTLSSQRSRVRSLMKHCGVHAFTWYI
jgi:hypothetical protein